MVGARLSKSGGIPSASTHSIDSQGLPSTRLRVTRSSSSRPHSDYNPQRKSRYDDIMDGARRLGWKLG